MKPVFKLIKMVRFEIVGYEMYDGKCSYTFIVFVNTEINRIFQ